MLILPSASPSALNDIVNAILDSTRQAVLLERRDRRKKQNNQFALEPLKTTCKMHGRVGLTPSLLCMGLLIVLSFIDVKGEVCYSVFGCFSNDFPFNRTHIPLPEPPHVIHTRFLLFTRTSPWQGEWLDSINSIRNSQFNASRHTVLIIHGFAGFTVKMSITQEADWWGLPMKNQLLYKEDFNVIIVDWMRGAWFPFTRAVGNTRLVGAQGAHLLETLEQLSGRRLPFIHIIGFSFGAHVAGYIGKRMIMKGRTVDRITGLDPAAMWFAGLHKDVRLHSGDASFVDIIHTSSAYGMTANIGHVDFYPNGGKKQPGCNNVLAGFTNFLFCSHKKAPAYFTSSIFSSCPLYAFPCRSENDFKRGKCLDCNGPCITMGYHAYAGSRNGTLQDDFYLTTTTKQPFCEYNYEISFKTMNSWFAGVYGPVFVKLKGEDGTSHTSKSMKYIPGCTEIKFLFVSPSNLGKLKRITVWHHGIFQSWGLERVIVRPSWNQERYVTHTNKWLRYGQKISKHLISWQKDIRRQRRIAERIANRRKRI